MYFKQIFMDDMGSLSFLFGCTKEKVACVINPKKNVKDYINAAKGNDLEITHIFETPEYSRERSGNLELKFRTGAELYFLEEDEEKTIHNVAIEGEAFNFGAARLEIIDSPEHHPFSTSIVVTDKTNPDSPNLILTRESLFIGDLARPDLSSKEISNRVINYLDFHETGQNFKSQTRIPLDNTIEKPLKIAI